MFPSHDILSREREKLRIYKLNDNIGYIGKWQYKLDDQIEKERLLEEARHLAREIETTDYYEQIRKKYIDKIKGKFKNISFGDLNQELINESETNEFLKMFNERYNVF